MIIIKWYELNKIYVSDIWKFKKTLKSSVYRIISDTNQFKIEELMNKYKKETDKLFNHKIIRSEYDYWLNSKKIYTFDEVIRELKILHRVDLIQLKLLIS